MRGWAARPSLETDGESSMADLTAVEGGVGRQDVGVTARATPRSVIKTVIDVCRVISHTREKKSRLQFVLPTAVMHLLLIKFC